MKVKMILSLTVFFAVFGTLNAQITVTEYEKQISANMEDLPTVDAIEVSSTCGEVKISVDDKLFSGGCAGNLVRTYTYTDDCGNEESAMQFIKLIDTTAPIFEAENEVYVGADAASLPEDIAVSDNSTKKLKPEYSDKKKKDHILRTWTVTDDCGNNSTFEQKLLLKEEL